MRLENLTITGLGPFKKLSLDLAPRLNILTGDNGVGKSLILDLAFYIATGAWPDVPIWVAPAETSGVKVGYRLHHPIYDIGGTKPREESVSPEWHGQKLVWGPPTEQTEETGESEYVWTGHQVVQHLSSTSDAAGFDPLRDRHSWFSKTYRREVDVSGRRAAQEQQDLLRREPARQGTALTPEELLEITQWSYKRDDAYALYSELLRSFAPPGERLEPGRVARVHLGSKFDEPWLQTSAGEVPLLYASSAQQRVAKLAYSLASLTIEHQIAVKAFDADPSEYSLLMMIDEIETHLHPRWQRTVLRSIVHGLSGVWGNRVQIIATTHSPLVLAGLESVFDSEQDRVTVLEARGGAVTAKPFDWERQGGASRWLESDVFGLETSGSLEREKALKAAHAFLRKPTYDTATAAKIEGRLAKTLAPDDTYWPIWRAARFNHEQVSNGPPAKPKAPARPRSRRA
jgi:hypothetical protein